MAAGSGGRGDHFVAHPLRANCDWICDCGYGYGYGCGGRALAWRPAIGNALMSSDALAGTWQKVLQRVVMAE